MADELELRLSERYHKKIYGEWGKYEYEKKLILFVCPVDYTDYTYNNRKRTLTRKTKGVEIIKEWIVPAKGKTERSIRGRAMKEAKYLLSGGLFLVRMLQANGELKYERVKRPPIRRRRSAPTVIKREGDKDERVAEDQGKAGAAQSGDASVGVERKAKNS